MILESRVKDLERFEEVMEVVFRQQMGYVLDSLNLRTELPLLRRIAAKSHSRPGPQRLRETLEELGTVYIKFGQILAERPDIVPEKYRQELEKLQEGVEPFEYGKFEEIVEEEIGTDSFREIQEEPLASASIAQVHRATLPSGEEVIIKARRPGIREEVEQDLQILEFLTREAEKHVSYAKKVKALKFVEEFSSWTMQELDFEREALNAIIFRENMEDEENVKVPKVYEELTTEKVLVMEYVEGTKCTEDEKLKQLDIDKEQIARTAIRAGLKQSMRDGFFHADPHPSNFLISDDGKMIYLDFGMMGTVTTETSEKLGLLMLYLIRENVAGMVEVLEDLGHTTEEYDREKVKEKVEKKILLLKNTTIQQHSLTQEMFDLFVQISRHGLHMPSSLTLMGKSLVTMEGIGLTIYPDFRINDEYESTIEEMLMKQNQPEDVMEDLAVDMIQNKDLISRLPSKLNRKMEPSEPTVEVHETGGGDYSTEALTVGIAVIAGSLLNSGFLTPFQKTAVAAGAVSAAGYLYLHSD